MSITKIEENEDELNIFLDEKRAGSGAFFFLRLIILFCFSVPIIALFVLPFKIAVLIFVGLMGLFGYYFLRILLWNTRGEEIISINKKGVTQAFDYGWFVEQDVNVLENNNLQITVNFNEPEEAINDQKNILDSEHMKEEMRVANIIFYKNDKEYFSIKTKTSKKETKLLKEKIIKRLI